MKSHEADGVTWTLYKVIFRDYYGSDNLICIWEISNDSPELRTRGAEIYFPSGPDLDGVIDMVTRHTKEGVNLKTLPHSVYAHHKEFFGHRHFYHKKEPVPEGVLWYVQKELRRRQKLIGEID